MFEYCRRIRPWFGDGWELNAVTSYGCSVGYTNNGVRYNVQGSECA